LASFVSGMGLVLHDRVRAVKRSAVIALLTVLSAVNLYSAFSPDWSRQYFPLPFKSYTLRKVVHILAGGLFLLCVLLLIYGAINPRG
jgi:threonine/homoserine/homoserine lactone efflux protein